MATASLKCIFASLPRTTRGVPIQLGGDPKKENFLYCNGNNVYIRDIENPAKCDVYSEHRADVTAAKYSPSRFYIASGDATGILKIWDTVNLEHIQKSEFPVLAGQIKDIEWAPDSTKLAVVGEGKEKYAAVITYDTGNTVGSLDGHCKNINSVAYKPTRPFRIATASEDQNSHFYEGPPFKYKLRCSDQGSMVNSVMYHPKGEVYVTGGSGGKVIVYDGKTSEMIGELGAPKAHAGGIYAMSFNDDGSELLTVSGDKTAKIWDIETRQLKVEFVFGKKEMNDMQVGCLWQGDNIITVSLSGYINYLDYNNPCTPRKILKGHNKPITAMVVSPDQSRVFTASSSGQIMNWDPHTGLCEEIGGTGHTNQVTDMVIEGDTLISVAMDDTVRFTSLSEVKNGNSTKLPSQPRSVAAMPGLVVVACIEHNVVLNNGNIVYQQEVKYEPSCVDIHPNRATVAIGAVKDKNVHLFELDGATLNPVEKFSVEDDVTDLKFSPDGAYLAVCTGSNKLVNLYTFGKYDEPVYSYKKHTAKVFSLCWNTSSQNFTSCGLDGSIFIWTLDPHYKRCAAIEIKKAHNKAEVKKVGWLSDNTLISCSKDSTLRQWDLQFAC